MPKNENMPGFDSKVRWKKTSTSSSSRSNNYSDTATNPLSRTTYALETWRQNDEIALNNIASNSTYTSSSTSPTSYYDYSSSTSPTSYYNYSRRTNATSSSSSSPTVSSDYTAAATRGGTASSTTDDTYTILTTDDTYTSSLTSDTYPTVENYITSAENDSRLSSIYSSDDYVYSGGDQVISDYDSDKSISLQTPATGAFFGGGNFALTSPTGTLFIQNANDKIIDFRDGAGNPYAKAYAATNPGVIDGRGLAGYEVITGSDFGNDFIYAGDGGSQLWGGGGFGQDILTGGGGADIFIGGKNQGADIFMNASSADTVNLNDATLSDIVAANEVNGAIALAFNNGNTVAIQSSEVLSSAIVLADGSAYRFNHATKAWQNA